MRVEVSPGIRGIGGVALLFLTVACAGAPKVEEELPAPALEAGVQHYAGSPISGVGPIGTAAQIDRDPAHALAARCDILYVEREVEGALVPIATRARIMAGVRGDEPIRATSQLSPAARIATDSGAAAVLDAVEKQEFGRSRTIASLVGALLDGMTLVFHASAQEGFASPEHGLVRPRIELELARGSGDARDLVTVALGIEDLVPVRAAPSSDESLTDGSADNVLRREYIVIDEPLSPTSAPIVIVLQSPFRDGHGRCFVVRLSIDAAPGDADGSASADSPSAEHAAIVARALQDAAEIETLASERARPLSDEDFRLKRFAGAISELGWPPNRRAALELLAAETQADICDDFAIACDAATLDEFVDGLSGVLKEPDIGYALERAILGFLAARKSAGSLAPELESILVRHTGEIGRTAGGLGDLLAVAHDLPTLRTRILEENLVFLEDSSLSSRVRAFDWLSVRGRAPAGYDPHASANARRAALDAVEAAAATGGDR